MNDETTALKIKDFFEVDKVLTGTTNTEVTASTGLLPIGSVVPWLKTLTGTPSLPTGWVQCDGQTLSDSESVYNGVVIPNLNGGNKFLRGNSTSGGTGGSLQPTLATWGSVGSVAVTDGVDDIGDVGNKLYKIGGSGGSTLTRRNSYLQDGSPPYYDVVWIIRVK